MGENSLLDRHQSGANFDLSNPQTNAGDGVAMTIVLMVNPKITK
jgi:hypothetical protein